MYHLTLTKSERAALDWVGGRYPHGHDLYKLLFVDSTATPDDADWDSDCDIKFIIPEHVAWQIGEMGREGNYLWDCFADDLAQKLTDLCMKIV